jgi:hypothetical protein
MNARKVKIFESCSYTKLEERLNEWLKDMSNRVESIAYSVTRDKCCALVSYQYDDEHKTEPLP